MTTCPYCKIDTGGNHALGCPNNPVAVPPVRSEPLLAAIDVLQAQFTGYALRVAPSDFGNDIILGTIAKIRRIAANAGLDGRREGKV